MFDSLFGLFSTDLAIDLGTANTLVYVRNQGIVVNEPSVVAISKNRDNSSKVLAVGQQQSRCGRRLIISSLFDLCATVSLLTSQSRTMLKYFISNSQSTSFRTVSSRYLCTAGITNVERKAVREAAENAGVREVWLIEQPIAAAIGAGLPVREARGNMIVDIGGGTTDVAVVSMSGMGMSALVAGASWMRRLSTS